MIHTHHPFSLVPITLFGSTTRLLASNIDPGVPYIALNSMVNLVLPRRSHDSQSDGIFLQKFCRTAAEPACASTSKPNTSWHGVIPASIPTDRDSHNPMPDLLGAHSGSPTPLCHSAEVAPSSPSAPATHRFHWKSATMLYGLCISSGSAIR